MSQDLDIELNPAAEIQIHESQGYDYSKLVPEKQKHLRALTQEIYAVYKQTLENVLRLGEYFTEAKKALPYGEFQKWVREEFTNGPIQLKMNSVQNWMAVYKTYRDNPEFRAAMENIDLWVLYRVCKHTLEPSVREAVFEIAQTGARPSMEDFESLKRLTKQYNLSQVSLKPEVKERLIQTSIAERPEELERLARFSKRNQLNISQIIETGEAQSVKEAAAIVLNRQPEEILVRDLSESQTEQLPLPQTDIDFELWIEHFTGTWDQALTKIDSNTVNLIVAECPLKYSWVKSPSGLSRLSQIANEILAPGGMMLATCGHKAIMSSEPALAPLEPFHIVTLRRMPGHTRSIVGINVAAASVHLTLSYKPPFRAPQTMLVDLHSVDENPLPELSEIPNGIETGFSRIFQSLIQPGDIVVHAICGENHFRIRPSLKESALEAGAYGWLTVGS
ncbi:hypothetical protein ACQ4M3_09465 [Leptolyngbya sp. AN03gr2]|uniref:hypothetical protein n=1 Tax=Leptolyngbya sp. AN03gr2 TaxID=3423364 RepID=UPI003D31BFC9